MLLGGLDKLWTKVTVVLSTGGHCLPRFTGEFLEWIKERMGNKEIETSGKENNKNN